MKPLLIFDGDCQFCLRWIMRWQKITQDKIDYQPYQEAASRFPQISEENFKKSVQLIDSDGTVYQGAEAVLRTLAVSPRTAQLLWCYQHIPFVKLISEFVYRLVASNRKFFSRFLKPAETCGHCSSKTASHAAVRWIFVRAIGVIYLFAFVSLWTQISPLLGRNGILPAQEFLDAVSAKVGFEKFFLLPTLCWLSAGDLFLHLICAAGTLFSIFLIAGIWPASVSFLLWLFYLSIVNIGRDFFSFQWDVLLLETGFLTIFLSPFKRFDKLSESPEPPKPAVWLLRFLLFRLMFFSGFSKLASNDLAWRHLTALLHHYETQPLPTWIAWHVHQFPLWFQKVSAVFMFIIELAVPFFIFSPRKLRLWAYSILILFQLAIILTGNYCFFNLLTIVLCLALLDDQALPGHLQGGSTQKLASGQSPAASDWHRKPVILILVMLLTVSVTQSMDRLFARPRALAPIRFLSELVSPFHLVNGYGLFAVMTLRRPEIIIEGSADGKTWLEYEFKFKPGDVKRRPRFNIPHQPRLDWQMWFAALSNFQTNRWFIRFSEKILKNSKEVLSLMKKNPFPDNPPRYLRAVLYDYHFTDFKTRKLTGAWWVREQKELYAPVMSLKAADQQ